MRHLPNTITLCNLLCGAIACGFAYEANFRMALLFIVLGATFDFFDGFAARLLKVSSPVGKELDSLADDITFGLAPAVVAYRLIGIFIPAEWSWAAYGALLIAAFSALRLAKFNVDERQSHGFIGLPTPANALFWSALAWNLHDARLPEGLSATAVSVCLLVMVAVSCWILVSEIPMFALKFKTFRWEGNALRYSFIAISGTLIAICGVGGFPAVIILYVLLSLVTQRKK